MFYYMLWMVQFMFHQEPLEYPKLWGVPTQLSDAYYAALDKRPNDTRGVFLTFAMTGLFLHLGGAALIAYLAFGSENPSAIFVAWLFEDGGIVAFLAFNFMLDSVAHICTCTDECLDLPVEYEDAEPASFAVIIALWGMARDRCAACIRARRPRKPLPTILPRPGEVRLDIPGGSGAAASLGPTNATAAETSDEKSQQLNARLDRIARFSAVQTGRKKFVKKRTEQPIH